MAGPGTGAQKILRATHRRLQRLSELVRSPRARGLGLTSRDVPCLELEWLRALQQKVCQVVLEHRFLGPLPAPVPQGTAGLKPQEARKLKLFLCQYPLRRQLQKKQTPLGEPRMMPSALSSLLDPLRLRGLLGGASLRVVLRLALRSELLR